MRYICNTYCIQIKNDQTMTKKYYSASAPRRTVLVTGAGGTIGSRVLRGFVRFRPDVEVRAFDLASPQNRDLFDQLQGHVEPFYGDITKPETLVEACTGVDYVVHLAAIIPPAADQNPDLANKINVEGTNNLLEVLKAHSPEAFIAMASSVSVYGDRVKDPMIRVTDPVHPSEGDHYAQTKLAMEQLIRESGLRYTIFRLSAIMGAENHTMSGIMFHMPLDTTLEICTPADTARAFVNALDHLDELDGQTFNLGGGKECTTTYREFLTRNFKIYGLGEFDFPSRAFATKNFHCGYFADGKDLEDIVHFRTDTLADYYYQLSRHIPGIQKLATKLFASAVRSYLLHISEPYVAWKTQDVTMMRHFFRDEDLTME